MTNEEFIESIRLVGEEWRDVVGYEGKYMVSSYGRVASLLTYRKTRSLLRQVDITPGKADGSFCYKQVMLYHNGTRKKYSVHRLVAIAFLPNPNNLPQIDHIDGNRSNNFVSNLRWCDAFQNMNNSNTRIKISIGQRSVRKNITHKSVVQLINNKIVAIYESAYSTRLNGFTPQGVLESCHSDHRKHKGSRWMFLSDYETLISKSKNSTDPSIG